MALIIKVLPSNHHTRHPLRLRGREPEQVLTSPFLFHLTENDSDAHQTRDKFGCQIFQSSGFLHLAISFVARSPHLPDRGNNSLICLVNSLFRMTLQRAVVPQNEQFREKKSGFDGLKSANSLYFSLLAGNFGGGGLAPDCALRQTSRMSL